MPFKLHLDWTLKASNKKPFSASTLKGFLFIMQIRLYFIYFALIFEMILLKIILTG
ncbi:hypothetical protein QE422_002864 [Chryseobacterium sp. SORGH_AS 447]|nr:hypothetical protein [Chryseobacterium sp. SORGH_AS_0447]